MTASAQRYLYTASGAGGYFDEPRLAECVDRHRLQIERPSMEPLASSEPGRDARGLVLEMVYGWPNRLHLRMARDALRAGKAVWFYWPREGAVERIDFERLSSYRRLWAYVKLRQTASLWRYQTLQFVSDHAPARLRPWLRAAYHRARTVKARVLSAAGASLPAAPPSADMAAQIVAEYGQQVDWVINHAQPVAFAFAGPPSAARPVPGPGAYLRTDYWARINTGGSYGHTCYVAKELAAATQQMCCFMPHRYVLLDDLDVPQQVIEAPGRACDELSLIRANAHYYDRLAEPIARLRPAYLYERICLGNFVGARLSQELGIPYIVEYNGSEISMSRSFGNGALQQEAFFLRAEEAAFRQATVISVVSDAVRDDLLRRGVSARKVLVNPNGVDVDAYAPVDPKRRLLLRRELGFGPEHCVVGFIGTFGGWHGIDVLAEAIPQICRREARVRFLLIGDGNFKHLLDDAVKTHRLGDTVVCTGRVPHHEGARLLGACDVYVSPHSSHMVDSRFFGSPTKLFEYMAMGGGIVASDLEQIGEVLSPAVRADHLPAPDDPIGDQRAVLCAPGSVEEFVESVLYLAAHPEVSEHLGRNAREAAVREFSWQGHVERLWQFAFENRQ